MGQIIAIGNCKGGVAKTTSCDIIASIMSEKGYKVLCVDMDGQCSLSSLHFDTEQPKGIYDLLTGRKFDEGYIQKTKYYDLLPGTRDLYIVETWKTYGETLILKRVLEPLKARYDFILLDCPPSYSTLQQNCFIASDFLIVPTAKDFLCVDKAIDTLQTAISINKDLICLGVLFTNCSWNNRLISAKKVVEHYKNSVEGCEPFTESITNCPSISDAQYEMIPCIEYAKKKNAIKQYESVTKEILERIGKENGK